MPLVRMAFRKGRPKSFGKQAAKIVYETMVDTINVPPKENWSFGNGIAQYAE